MTDSVLSVHDLHVHDPRSGSELVRGVSFDVPAGGALGIVGESGSGKTLTCRTALGILPAPLEMTGGRVTLLGRDTATLTEPRWRELRGRGIGAVFQDPGAFLNPSLRIGSQVAEVLRVGRRLGRRAARAEALRLLTAVHLRDPERVSRQYPHELSGGMLQRVVIAAAIALDPQVLIADEATTALDVTVQAEILDLLADLRERIGLALVVVSHDLAVVAQLCEEVVVLRDGEVVERGATDAVLRAPRHPYTRLLIDEHNRYGLDRYLAPELEHAG
ncbi:ABC transporter ATP-binding protein [Pseudonocardia sp. MH-G8]|uniref:ABC transporter ATP-binding protein n=1 Tax=Pseudonocardia sp. MH-G8 TaxID=1854588 RepID=UPI000B9FE59C|nr:ABC transporter ATP-binding protein [Pseudonocardia sp. MH-G8]OZM77830.1 ABC transporter ATP-binding protein [Pseudonocardia sp. MH-G8]